MSGFSGTDCGLNTDDCDTASCLHGATCIVSFMSSAAANVVFTEVSLFQFQFHSLYIELYIDLQFHC